MASTQAQGGASARLHPCPIASERIEQILAQIRTELREEKSFAAPLRRAA